jgi:hypothetical protein
MKLKDFTRLKKYMMMTMSGSEAETAMALKSANAILVAEGLDWDRILNRTVTIVNEFEAAPEEREQSTKARIDAAFEEIEKSDPRGSFADFIADLKNQWENRGHLSVNQIDALMRSARRAQDERR